MIYIEWIEQLGVSNDDVSYGVATDSNGNVYISGFTRGILDSTQNKFYFGNTDAWVAKYDGQGNLLWTEQLGAARPTFGVPFSETDFSQGVATDSNGNVYITGNTSGSLEGTHAGAIDAWVAKYDTQGNLLWTEQLGTSENDYSERVATDSNGNVYITGNTSGSLDGVNAGAIDAWVAKYDTQGNLLWTKQLGTSGTDHSEGVAIDSNGHVYISGNTSGNLDGVNAGAIDAWVAKYDTQGNLLWLEQLGTVENDFSEGVATDSNGHVYITGNTSGSLDDTPNAGSADAWVAKYDTQGNLLWLEQLGTVANDYSDGVATDSNGHVYITGNTSGNLDGVNEGDEDSWVAKYDGQGTLLWTEQLGTIREDNSYGVTVDSNHNVYISGATKGNLDGVNAGINDEFPTDDAWVAKISQSFIPITRFQNRTLPGTYLFAGPAESQSIRENFPDFIEEGQAFKVGFEPGDDLIQLNRFQNTNVPGTYLYAGEAESQNIRLNFPNFIEEGIAFYVYDGAANIGVDFYRFQNLDVPGTYIFVGSEERQNILDNFPNFVEEGVAFEVVI